MVYQWKKGTRCKASAQDVGEEIQSIYEKKGGVKPVDLVSFAKRKKSSALYDCFEWDDETAAEQYRVEQAGYLIRHITVVMSDGGEDPIPVRCFVSVVDEDDDRKFIPVETALSHEQIALQVLEEVKDDIREAREKLNRYHQIIDGSLQIIESLDEILSSL